MQTIYLTGGYLCGPWVSLTGLATMATGIQLTSWDFCAHVTFRLARVPSRWATVQGLISLKGIKSFI